VETIGGNLIFSKESANIKKAMNFFDICPYHLSKPRTYALPATDFIPPGFSHFSEWLPNGTVVEIPPIRNAQTRLRRHGPERKI
jgi:hypothetical protein